VLKDIALSKLIVDEELYPRQNVNEVHVRSMVRTLQGKQELPPIVVWKQGTNGSTQLTIVDGWHRYQATSRTGAKSIRADIRNYKDKAEAFKDAVALNTAHGLRLDDNDCQKVIETGELLGLKEFELALVLRTSIQHLHVLKGRFATVKEATKAVGEWRKVALKNSCRHLAGHTVTTKQVEAMTSAPGQSYLLTVDQLISAVRYKLLPPREEHLALWERLAELHTLLGKMLK
jgi:uncharacterized ParB-like nuclease family protein